MSEEKSPIPLEDDRIEKIKDQVASTSQVKESYEEQIKAAKERVSEKSFPEVKLKNLRTFQGDAAEAIRKDNASVLTIALAEKRKRQEKQPRKDSPNRKNILIFVVSILLILLGVGAVLSIFYFQKKSPNPEPVQMTEKTTIPFNTKIVVSTDGANRNKLLDYIYLKKQAVQLKQDEVLYLEFSKKTGQEDISISTNEFLSIMKVSAPAPLLRSFEPQFMMGFYGVDGKNEPFLLMKLSSFENAFDGMLGWEKNLYSDLSSIFTLRSIPLTAVESNSNTATTSSSTPTENRSILNLDTPNPSGFEDETIKNRDLRILKNSRGETIMFYSFIDKETLLFAGDTNLLNTIAAKIISSKLIR